MTSAKGETPGAGLVLDQGGWKAVTDFRQEYQVRIGGKRILGDSDFVEKVLGEDEIAMESRMLRQG